MIYKITNTIVLLFLTIILSAQGKYGLNEQECKENLSMFREYYKQKNYLDAYVPWRWALNNCPQSSENIYKNGPKIIKEKIKFDQSNKSFYIDSLMMLFDQRITFFGKEGFVLGLKGFELVALDKKRSQEAFLYLQKSLQIDGNNASVQAVYGYMKAIVNLEKSGEKSKIDVLDAYSLVSEIINYNILNQTKATKNFIKYSQKVESLFTPYANCDDLVNLYNQKLDTKLDDLNFLDRVVKLLSNKQCTDSDLFLKASTRIFELEPSAFSANKISKLSISKGKKSDAIKYAMQAVDLELDPQLKAKYYLTLADAYRFSGAFASSKKAVNSALNLRSGWGEAYLNLGSIYVASAKGCGSDFENQTVYWLAVDAYKKALIDDETSERAKKSIKTYSKYFPTKESCFFNGVTAGSKYSVLCWGNEKTTVRTSD